MKTIPLSDQTKLSAIVPTFKKEVLSPIQTVLFNGLTDAIELQQVPIFKILELVSWRVPDEYWWTIRV